MPAEHLREQLAEVLNTTLVTPEGDIETSTSKFDRHDRHNFLYNCAVCQGNVAAIADTVLTVRDEELERLRAAKRHLSERISIGQEGWNEIHREAERLRAELAEARESRLHRDRDCYWRRRTDKAEAERDALKAAIKRERTEHDVECDWCVEGCPCPVCEVLDALAVPESAEKPEKPAGKVPDRIDYDGDGELDDVVVNDCMAHLERMDDSRWYLGLYGNDGRILQIDIASKTGRAEVTGFVKYSEGIGAVPEINGDGLRVT